MVLALNLLCFVVVVGLVFTWWKTKKHWLLLVLLLFGLVYPKILPSLPKGEVKRSAVPSFNVPTGEIEDRNRKPIPLEQRREEQAQSYKDGLPFLDK